MMEIRRYESDLLSSNMFVVVEGMRAIVIDPFRDTTPVKGLRFDKIILTHEHYDHISGVNMWKEKTGAPVLCSKACAENIQDCRKNMAHLFKEFCELQTWFKVEKKPDMDRFYTCSSDEVFEDRVEFQWEGHDFHLFEVPGHSMGSIGIILDDKCFFSGDSLFGNREIELRFPGGNRKKWESIGKPRIDSLPKRLKVYPGHFNDFIYQGREETEK